MRLRRREGVSSTGRSFPQISNERKEVRQDIADLRKGGLPPSQVDTIVAKHHQPALDALNAEVKKFNLAELGGLAKAKQLLREQRLGTHGEYGLDYRAMFRENPGLQQVLEGKDALLELEALRFHSLLKIFNPKTTTRGRQRNELIVKDLLEQIQKQQKQEGKTDSILLRSAELIQGKEQLEEPGHICITPSVGKYLEAIGGRLLTGKPMFLHGPTGTGKTSLARFAAQRFTGKTPEMVFCNPQTRESHVWGKTGIRPAKDGAIETVEIHGPLAKAMAEGKVVVFDEFTALPQEQMVFIKGILNAKVGDKVNVVGNGLVEIQPGFQMVFTANLKSEKNPERQELPPEITREFEQNNLEVNYLPPDEAYTVMLNRLQNADGSIDVSDYDANETLPILCRAMADIQESYTRATNTELARVVGAESVSGKVTSLKKFVLTQGSVESILSAWKVEKQLNASLKTFCEFLDERLKTALTFKEYSLADRVLAAKILASKGLLSTVSAQELDLPADVFSFDAAKVGRETKGSESRVGKSKIVRHYSLRDVALLDPFHTRKESAIKKARARLPATYRKEGEGVEQVDPFLVAFEAKKEEIFEDEDDPESSLLEAESILGPQFIGPTELKQAYRWGDILPQNIPPIPFSKEALEQAKANGSYLILCLDKDPKTNAPITGSYLQNKVYPLLQAKNAGKLVNDPLSTELFYTTQTPRAGWMLADPTTLPGTKNKTYTQQTKLLREALKLRKDLSPEELQAIAQCTDQELDRLEALSRTDWKQATDELLALPLNQLTRRLPAETLYTCSTLFLTRNIRHLETEYDCGIGQWTSGMLADVGVFDSLGASLLGWFPRDGHANAGVVLSRRKTL